MGRFFGREPRYTREEAEAQAKAAIDAATKRGRPPAEEWKGLASRMGDLDRDLAARPPVDLPPPPRRRSASAEGGRPRVVSDILRPRPAPKAEPGPLEATSGPPGTASGAAPESEAKGRGAAPPAPSKQATTRSAAAPGPAKRVTSKAAPRQPRAAKAAEGPAPAPAKAAKRPARAADPKPASPAKRRATKKQSG